jgi:hypothetical protein
MGRIEEISDQHRQATVKKMGKKYQFRKIALPLPINNK